MQVFLLYNFKLRERMLTAQSYNYIYNIFRLQPEICTLIIYSNQNVKQIKNTIILKTLKNYFYLLTISTIFKPGIFH